MRDITESYRERRETYIVPQRHDQNHGLAQRRRHGAEAADLIEAVAIVEGGELGLAKVGRQRMTRDASGRRVGHGDLLAALDEVLRDVVVAELGHHPESSSQPSTRGYESFRVVILRELFRSVDCLALAVEVLSAHAICFLPSAM